MKYRIAKKIVVGRVLPGMAPFIASGGGIGPNNACYSDSERLAARVFVSRKVGRIVRRVSEETGGCIAVTREKVRSRLASVVEGMIMASDFVVTDAPKKRKRRRAF